METQNYLLKKEGTERTNSLAPKSLCQKMEEIVTFISRGEKLKREGLKLSKTKSSLSHRSNNLTYISSTHSIYHLTENEMSKA